MKPLITSEPVSSGQKESCVTLITDATRKAAGVALDDLIKRGVLTKQNIEQIRWRGNEVVTAITSLVLEKFASMAENVFGLVKLISGAKRLTLPATDGKEMLGKAEDVFAWIDPDFESYGCNVKSAPTEVAHAEVYELIKDGHFKDIFGGFGVGLDKLRFTQPQIKAFAVNHRDMLRTDGYATLFLFKVGNEFFVAHVSLISDGGLRVCVFRFSDDDVWLAGPRHRVVVPQLAPLAA